VFDTILAHATRLCEAQLGFLHLYDGDALRLTAHRGATAAFVEFLNRGPIRAGPGTGIGRAVRERRAIQIADVVADAAYYERDPLRVASVELEGARLGCARQTTSQSSVWTATCCVSRPIMARSPPDRSAGFPSRWTEEL
jgi:GAF domain